MSAPFSAKQFTFTQPDGTELWVKGWGNQDYAVFECLNGYTVVKDPGTGFYVYADLSPDGEELKPTELQPRVSPTKPKDVGLASGLRVKPEEAKAMAVHNSTLPEGKSRWEVRRAEFKLARRRAAEMTAQGMAAMAPSRETTGDYVGLCLLIDFPDQRGIISREEVDAFCNQPGYSGFGNNGSVYDYFFDVSGGKLRYKNIVTPYYTTKQPRSYYTNVSPRRAKELIIEALDYFKDEWFDFSQLTVDEEQYVYAINAFYAGECTNNWAEGLWPHQHSLYPDSPSGHPLDSFMQAKDYQITNMGDELMLGTFCHENGHMLCEFPDLYPYQDKRSGVGHFCLMGMGNHANQKNPTQVNPYLKYRAGWAGSVTTISAELNALAQAGAANPEFHATAKAGTNQFFIYPKGGSDATEYFIIENRFQEGRDEALPGSGLAIWHIDELGDNTGWNPADMSNIECALLQADGRSELEIYGSMGDTTDLFAAGINDHFGGTTNPKSVWWDGTPSGLEIETISVPGAMMTFTAVNSGESDDQHKEAMHMITFYHTVNSGETLSQIAEMYGTSIQQLGQDNDILAEIAEDNDLTGAYLTINLPSEVITWEWIQRAYHGQFEALNSSEPDNAEQRIWQLDAFLDQCVREIYQRVISYHENNPPLNQNAAHVFHSTQSLWDYFRNMDFQWGRELNNLLATDGDWGSSAAMEFTRGIGVAQIQLLKARAEQLIVAESLLMNIQGLKGKG